MKPGVCDKILLDGSAYGCDVSQVLNHGYKGNGCNQLSHPRRTSVP